MNRTQFKARMLQTFSKKDVMLLMAAYDFGKAAHRTQERESVPSHALKEEKRYFNHPKRIALQMFEDGVRDIATLCIAFLHDSFEDSGIFGNQKVDGYDEALEDVFFRLERMFSKDIAWGVIDLTMPIVQQDLQNLGRFSSKNKCLAFYKNNLKKADIRSLLVKLYDRLDNLETIEVKPPKVVKMKLEETEGFYIPLFSKSFSTHNKEYRELAEIGWKKNSELEKLVKEKKLAPPAFQNRYGIIKVGTRVSFLVENQDSWGGDNNGILIYEKNEFKIKTQNSGILTIDKGYDAYSGTIQPVS